MQLVALAWSTYRKDQNFAAPMAFQFASTNLVLELGILLAVRTGRQFTHAEVAGGMLVTAMLALLFNIFLSPKLVEADRAQTETGIAGISTSLQKMRPQESQPASTSDRAVR